MGQLFKSLGQLIWEKKVTILIVLTIIVVLIIVIKELNKIRQKKKELRQAASDRARDENLNSFILNKHATSANKEVYVPYEVDYSQAVQNPSLNMNTLQKSKAVMVQIIERTGLSERKFAMNASRGISIGTSKDNDITLISDDRNEYQCQIFAIGNKVFTKNAANGARIILRRKKEQAIVDTRGIRIKSGDILLIGSCTYTITIVR